MGAVELKIFDEKGNMGIAVYKARKRGEAEWKLLYIWADYNPHMYVDGMTGEFVSKGYYMYAYLGSAIHSMFSYDCNGLLGQVLLGRADKKSRDGFEKHASLVTYWGRDVITELFHDMEVDWEKGVNMIMSNRHRGKIFPTEFIAEKFPTYIFRPFWKPEKWDRLPEDNEFSGIAN